jgi:flavin-dependent dehydrogenase
MQKSLIVIGAGPAGTSAAITAALAGIDTAIVDAIAFPRDRPGETRHPGIQSLIAQLGVEEQLLSAGFDRHEGTWVQWGGKRRFEPFGRDESGPWRGFQAWRADFDSILLERAREAGVRILNPCRAAEPIVDAGRVVGVVTSRGPIRANFVIDAAGGNHWLARRLGIPIEQHSPKLVARYGYTSSKLGDDDGNPEIIADDKGWTWSAKIRAGHYHWTRLNWESDDSEKAGSATDKLRAADVTWRILQPTAGPGWFAAGDAAAVLDPASSHGVMRAVMTGIMAADVIKRIAVEGQSEKAQLDGYCRWLRDWFERDVQRLRQLYGDLPQPPVWLDELG